VALDTFEGYRTLDGVGAPEHGVQCWQVMPCLDFHQAVGKPWTQLQVRPWSMSVHYAPFGQLSLISLHLICIPFSSSNV